MSTVPQKKKLKKLIIKKKKKQITISKKKSDKKVLKRKKSVKKSESMIQLPSSVLQSNFIKLGPSNYVSNELEYEYESDDASIVESLDSQPNFDLINKASAPLL